MRNYQSPRVVLDTNILVSALVFGGNPRKVTDLIAKDSIVLIISEPILIELRRVIKNRFPSFLKYLNKYESLLLEYSILVKAGYLDVNISRDPDDNVIIETALIGGADFIVSGDKDLLDIGNIGRLKITSAKDFLAKHPNH